MTAKPKTTAKKKTSAPQFAITVAESPRAAANFREGQAKPVDDRAALLQFLQKSGASSVLEICERAEEIFGKTLNARQITTIGVMLEEDNLVEFSQADNLTIIVPKSGSGSSANGANEKAARTWETAKKADEFRFVPTADLILSPTEPQAARRAWLKQEDLNELAESIRQRGIIEPLIVRASNDASYEIVCGERRFLAAEKCGLEQVPVIVRDLSDDDVLEVQLDENLHRKDIHPLVETVWYAHLRNRLELNVRELSERVGKAEKYVAQRLKLGNLIDEAREDFRRELITLGHALEIAKFAPAVQPEVLALCYESKWENGAYVPDKSEPPQSVRGLREDIESEILLTLDRAPFSTKDTTLRDDGLACTKCPERTGANPGLFDEWDEDVKKNDHCLNKSCFESKTRRQILNKRDELTKEAIAAGRFGADYQAALVEWNHAGSADGKALGALNTQQYTRIWDEKRKCEFAEQAIQIDRDGELSWICRSADCSTHSSPQNRTVNSSSSASGGEEKDKSAYYRRKQEIFDVRVGERVRQRILVECAEKFAVAINADAESAFAGTIFQADELPLLERLFAMVSAANHHTANIIIEIFNRQTGAGIKRYYSPERERLAAFAKLDARGRAKLFFLLTYAHLNELLPEQAGAWKPQKEIMDLAGRFAVDYREVDALERVQLTDEEKSYKKFKPIAVEYLNRVQNGDSAAKKPIFWKVEEKEA